MKISPALLALSRDHHRSLSLANQAINTAKKGQNLAIKKLCTKIGENFKIDHREHFEVEESLIFEHLSTQGAELYKICTQLAKDHKILIQLADELLEPSAQTAEKLAVFGQLLQTHIRIEDRKLFPNIHLLPQVATEQLLAYQP